MSKHEYKKWMKKSIKKFVKKIRQEEGLEILYAMAREVFLDEHAKEVRVEK